MLDMMGQMMGKKPGAKPGEGMKGDSDAANTDTSGESKGEDETAKKGERRVPRAAGKSGTKLPPEFQKALDGYNKKAKAK
ncbi:MAG: hypothetical protein ACJAQT_001228 [Akkermansiaceae bacterium]|jgi:hypothetical protein